MISCVFIDKAVCMCICIGMYVCSYVCVFIRKVWKVANEKEVFYRLIDDSRSYFRLNP